MIWALFIFIWKRQIQKLRCMHRRIVLLTGEDSLICIGRRGRRRLLNRTMTMRTIDYLVQTMDCRFKPMGNKRNKHHPLDNWQQFKCWKQVLVQKYILIRLFMHNVYTKGPLIQIFFKNQFLNLKNAYFPFKKDLVQGCCMKKFKFLETKELYALHNLKKRYILQKILKIYFSSYKEAYYLVLGHRMLCKKFPTCDCEVIHDVSNRDEYHLIRSFYKRLNRSF